MSGNTISQRLRDDSLEIQIKILSYKEDIFYIAYTPLFDIAVNASTYLGAKKSLSTALDLLIESWDKKGLKEQKFKELGIIDGGKNRSKKIEQSAFLKMPFGVIEKKEFKSESMSYHVC